MPLRHTYAIFDFARIRTPSPWAAAPARGSIIVVRLGSGQFPPLVAVYIVCFSLIFLNESLSDKTITLLYTYTYIQHSYTHTKTRTYEIYTFNLIFFNLCIIYIGSMYSYTYYKMWRYIGKERCMYHGKNVFGPWAKTKSISCKTYYDII